MTGTPLVAMRGIAKRFGAVTALRGVDFSCAAAEIHALLGENGAGKSTLMHILFGLTAPDTGNIEVEGTAAQWRSPADAIARGLGMVHQHFSQVPTMTVLENVALGRPGLRADLGGARQALQAATEQTGLVLDPDARAETLPVGLRQRLEILKALARDVRVLILDEPTASLTPAEVDELFGALARLRGRGLAIVLITHKLREVAALADRVTVLRRGEVVLAGRASAYDADALTAAMIGPGASTGLRDEVTGAPRRPVRAGSRGAAVLVARGLTVARPGGPPAVRDVACEVRAGEILGVAAVEGNGARELLRAVAGLLPWTGHLAVAGVTGFIPEDRQREGLVLDFPMVENMALGALRGWRFDRRFFEHAAAQAVDELAIRGDPRRPVRTLSGGNQQKVVLARALAGRPALLIAENPTRGLDIAAAAEVHARLRSAARDDHLAVLLYSTDLDEVVQLSDRVGVMVEGRWIEAPTGASRSDLGALMLGRRSA